MKVAVISNQAQSMLNFRVPLMVEMRELGHEVLAFAPDFDTESRAVLAKIGVEPVDFMLSRSSINPFKEVATIFELRRLLRWHQPDVSFSYFIKPVIYGTIAAWLAGVPRRFGLIEGLGYAFTDNPNQNRRRSLAKSIISLLVRLATSLMDRLIFLNSDDHQEFLDRGIVSKQKGIVVGAIGVDLEQWPVEPLPSFDTTFILVARLLRDKGIEEYINAARLLRPDHPKARFLLLGGLDDNPAAFSRAEIEAWVAEGLIEWPGHVAVKPWLALAGVFVLPSYREGLPRSTQEAMAMGRPVITTNVPGCRETVVEGRNGFLVPPRDSLALADAMRSFIEAPEIIASMGAESRKIAEERFDIRVQNRKFLDIMQLNGT